MAELSDYTPGHRPAHECCLPDLNQTVKAIRSHGYLRMHATGRLLDELEFIANHLGYEGVVDDEGFLAEFVIPR